MRQQTHSLHQPKNYQCQCSLFSSTKLTLSLSKQQPPQQRGRIFNSQISKDHVRKQEKLSLSEVKKDRGKSRGLVQNTHFLNPQEIKRTKSPVKYNIQYDSYSAYRNVLVNQPVKQLIINQTKYYQQPRVLIQSQPVVNLNNSNNYFNNKKYQRQETPVKVNQEVKNVSSSLYTKSIIQTRPLPSKYQSNIKGIATTYQNKKLLTEASQPKTLCSTRQPFLSTQASNRQLIVQTQDSIRQNSKPPTPSQSFISERSSSDRQKTSLGGFRAIQSVSCSSESDNRSQVLSFEGFRTVKQSSDMLNSNKNTSKYQTSMNKKWRSDVSVSSFKNA